MADLAYDWAGPLFAATTFRTLGTAATPQAIFALTNRGGAVRAILRELIVVVDTTVALATIACQVDTGVIRDLAVTTITGGTALVKTPLIAGATSDGQVAALGTTAADGAADTTLAGVGTNIWRNFVERMHTAVGEILFPPTDLLPRVARKGGVVIDGNHALTVNVTGTAGSNAATNHYIVSAIWQEARR